ncbi:hypothetical protein DACRYDRAFT_116468 [Dacryopinax primogenitus]|uniref:F-box domain-containing protein n=1 Tax=Dacryopinax primogenitus (strain DJM 731) TaxID=1858805 RepID=M5GBA5_DACPD|nr:uncharacterized protein DACRYDRAFT_116468 [Dacryopinax primogenitus]EJU01263.1 hypothetical protein DACRYDRAFT_116468 [Dacryopinax primogenitus]
MATFHSLPPELLLPILTPLPESSLVLCASVNRNWNAFATPLLYRRVAVYSWHCNAKTRAASLMRTLAERSEVARWVKHIDVRDFYRDFEFPLGQGEDRDTVFEHCERGLANCVNLESCIWPRYGTLTTQMLVALASLPRLQRLDINAYSGSYEPADLIRVRQIRALELAMPSKAVVAVLRRWLSAICVDGTDEERGTEIGLRELKIICHSFHLCDCPNADHIVVYTILRGCSLRLEDLGLESMSPDFDLKELATGLKLPRLKSLTLMLPAPRSPPQVFLDAILKLTAESSLTSFAVSLDIRFSLAPPARNCKFGPLFVRSLATQHAQTLKEVLISWISTPLEAVEALAALCPKPEVLVVLGLEFDRLRLREAISATSLPFLRTLHLGDMDYSFALRQPDPLSGLTELAKTCSSTLRQVGQVAKVYELYASAQHLNIY